MLSPYHQQRFLQQLATIVGARFPAFCEQMKERGMHLFPEGVPIFKKSTPQSYAARPLASMRFPCRPV